MSLRALFAKQPPDTIGVAHCTGVRRKCRRRFAAPRNDIELEIHLKYALTSWLRTALGGFHGDADANKIC